MVPGKERVIARISAKGSAPAINVLAKRPIKESDMPSFGTVRPLSEPKLINVGSLVRARKSPVHQTKPVDHLSLNLKDKGVDHKADVLFDIIRLIQPESETLPFCADSKGIFMGEKKVGQVFGSASDSPSLMIWMDWLFKCRASNYQLLDKLPLPVIANKFDIGEIAPFVNKLVSSRYAAITADKFIVQLKLFGAKTGPELGSFNIKWAGSP